MKYLTTPLSIEEIDSLQVGDTVSISGFIYTGRDAVLPKVVSCAVNGTLAQHGIDLEGSVIFHTAVSIAGVGPTSSNKAEIEESMGPLSEYGVRLHLGKGQISSETVAVLAENHSVFAVIPPVTALLEKHILERKVIAFSEEGMEAFHQLKVEGFTAIIAAAHGESLC